MSSLDIEAKRKMREMNATEMLQVIEAHDETLSMALSFDERVRLITRAKLRYPNADLRQVDLVEERGLNRNTLTFIGSCGFIEQNQNVLFQGFTDSRKSYLGCALAEQVCRNRIRTHYVRMPDLEEEWIQAQDKPLGASKFLKKYGSFTLTGDR